MSSIPPASSIASQPPVSPATPPRQDPQKQAADDLTATAVAAQSAKEARKGVNVDITV